VQDAVVHKGFLRIPDAVAALVRGMYATFRQPKPLHKIKLDHQKAPVIFGPWKEHAAQRIRAAACDGELPIYVRGDTESEPVVLRPDVVSRLITVRGGQLREVRPTGMTTGLREVSLHCGWPVRG
jgi:hypothetical protein